ncbi:FkbM family methyltransferase [Olleya sp. ITB9]|uniref:FkbM family methyltransferase n=1 Tax=Olleya sp. ITB9 TaxID=1715648 RepID=UPI0006D14871|nr:FkbM family methyltransferase [Olleya sp. ITB9]
MLINKLFFKAYQIKYLFKWIDVLGIFQYLKLISNLQSDSEFLELKLKSYTSTIYLRPKTSDFKIFKQIFIAEEYNVTYPNQVKTIIDAGSNCGYSIVYFKNKFKDAKVIAIEPDHSNIKMIRKNTQNLTNVELLEGGVWYKDSDLNILNKNAGKWAFRVVEAKKDEGEFKGFSINTILKQFNLESIDLLKLDIEGTEKIIFENNVQPWLSVTSFGFLELHENYEPGVTKLIHKILKSENFKISHSGENLVFSK